MYSKARAQHGAVTLWKETRYSSTKAEQEIKLLPNFEPVQYKVGKKIGIAVLIQDQEGNIKCDIGHMKKFIQPELCTEIHHTQEEGEQGQRRSSKPTSDQPRTFMRTLCNKF